MRSRARSALLSPFRKEQVLDHVTHTHIHTHRYRDIKKERERERERTSLALRSAVDEHSILIELYYCAGTLLFFFFLCFSFFLLFFLLFFLVIRIVDYYLLSLLCSFSRVDKARIEVIARQRRKQRTSRRNIFHYLEIKIFMSTERERGHTVGRPLFAALGEEEDAKLAAGRGPGEEGEG
jgi:hypothetical protein